MNVLRDPVRRFRVILYTGAAAIAFLFLLSAGLSSMANPAFCTSCHNHPWVFTTRLASPHAKVTCKGCHTPPGIVEYFIDEAKAGGKSGLFMILGKYEQPINYESIASLHIPDSACERCHVMDNRPVTPTRGLIIDHKKHKKKDINCTTCHNRAAHLDGSAGPWPGKDPKQWKGKGHTNFNSEYGCFRCHRDKAAEESAEPSEEGGEHSVIPSANAAEEESGALGAKSEGEGEGEGEGGHHEITPHHAKNQHEVNAPVASPECKVCHRAGVL